MITAHVIAADGADHHQHNDGQHVDPERPGDGELLPWPPMDDGTRYPTREEAGHGWASSFPEFRSTPALRIRGSLQDFLRDVSSEQIRA